MKKIFTLSIILTLLTFSSCFALGSGKGLFSGASSDSTAFSKSKSSKGLFSSKINITGIWYCEIENIRYVINIRKNGTMEILRKENGEKDFWRGSYTTFLKDIVFSVEESGHRTRFLPEELYEENLQWLINCKSDKNNTASITLKSKNITDDLISSDFSYGMSFSRK